MTCLLSPYSAGDHLNSFLAKKISKLKEIRQGLKQIQFQCDVKTEGAMDVSNFEICINH